MLYHAIAIVLAQSQEFHALDIRDAVLDKNFYALSELVRDPFVKREIQNDSLFVSLSAKRRNTLAAVAAATNLGQTDKLSELLWSQAEIDSVGSEFERLATVNPRIRMWINTNLRPSHAYYRFEGLSDGPFLAKCWRECAVGLNNVIEIYGTQSKRGPSPEVNGPIYRPANPLFGGLVRTMLDAVQEVDNDTAFGLSLQIGRGFLLAQARDEAGRHEPLANGENRKATSRLRTIHWSNYKYSAILVPGYGPEEAQVPFSPIGRLGCELAVRRWKAGLAPFILTSGGYVHPDRTPYCEALQMKRCLMQDFGVPEEAILVDPHARHTTTNIRNAVRILARSGAPMDKPLLVVTNTYQAKDIASPGFANRCQSVFGYLPFSNVKSLGNFEVSLLANLNSLTIDPTDPLDP